MKAVIARSYAFIYGRNQCNMALLGLIVHDDQFYELANEGVHVQIDMPARTVAVKDPLGNLHTFGFELSQMEERLIAGGGVTTLYKDYGAGLFRVAMQDSPTPAANNCEKVKSRAKSLVGDPFESMRPTKTMSPAKTKAACQDACSEPQVTW